MNILMTSQNNKEDSKWTHILMDFKKAFNNVSQSLLLHKLNNYRIVGIVNSRFKSFSTNRTKAVVTVATYLPQRPKAKIDVPMFQ
jgi:hypothetical protein